MKKMSVYFMLVLWAIFTFCFSGVANANLVPNGDFSSGLDGWNATNTNTVVTDYASLSATYTRWDLSSWNTVMDGSFVLLDRSLGVKIPLILGQIPVSISFDYAVAWADPVIPNAGGQYAGGYFYLETYGTGNSVPWGPLSHNEISWYTDGSRQQNVFTGTLYSENIIQHPDILLDGIVMNFLALNPNKALNQIIGIDNIQMTAVPEPAPVPTPEPSTMLMLGMGLAGLAGFGRKFKKN